MSVFSQAEQDHVDSRDVRCYTMSESAQDVLVVLRGCQGVRGFALHPINVIGVYAQGMKQAGLGSGEVA